MNKRCKTLLRSFLCTSGVSPASMLIVISHAESNYHRRRILFLTNMMKITEVFDVYFPVEAASQGEMK